MSDTKNLDDKLKKEMEAEKQAKSIEEKQQLYKEYCEMHDKAPVTRRDFLSAGVLSFSATLTLPPLAALLKPSQLLAQASGECPDEAPVGGLTMSPFVNLNLAGGAMLAANFVPMAQDGSMLRSYRRMGLGNAPPIEREFGNVPFAGNNISGFLRGLRSAMSQTTIDNTAFVGVNVTSQDDSGNNNMDISGLVTAAGVIGRQLGVIGNSDSRTSTRNDAARLAPPNPTRISSYTDLVNAIGGVPSGALAGMNESQLGRLYTLIKNLSDRQVASVINDSGGEQLGQLVRCATEKNVTLATNPKPSFDPRADAPYAAVWGLNANSDPRNQATTFGAMVNCALLGVAGAVGLNIGGYDYHNGTRTTGDQRDENAGQMAGRILESAAVRNERIFLYISTDGSCVSPDSGATDAPWTSDRGNAGCLYMIAFDPSGRPATNNFQLGHFTDAEAVDRNFITGGSAERAAVAVFANYLQFTGRIDLLEQVVPGYFSATDLNDILIFG